MGYQIVTWPWKVKLVTAICLECISQKRLEIETPCQRTTNRKRHMGCQMVSWLMTSRGPQRCCEAVRSAVLATAGFLFYLTSKAMHLHQDCKIISLLECETYCIHFAVHVTCISCSICSTDQNFGKTQQWVWCHLTDVVCDVDYLKQCLIDIWDGLGQSIIKDSVDEWTRRLMHMHTIVFFVLWILHTHKH